MDYDRPTSTAEPTSIVGLTTEGRNADRMMRTAPVLGQVEEGGQLELDDLLMVETITPEKTVRASESSMLYASARGRNTYDAFEPGRHVAIGCFVHCMFR